MLRKSQQRFIDTSIKHPNVQRCIASPLEYEFYKILETIGKKNVDWFHNSIAYYNEDEQLVAVPDFVFPKERLVIELDGDNHLEKQQKKRDDERNAIFINNGFYVLRIPTPLSKKEEAYWRTFIDEFVKLERNKYLNPIDIKAQEEEDLGKT